MSARPWAVVLAGGAGERLGGIRKAAIRIGGQRLIDRVATALGDVEQPLIVSTGTAFAASSSPGRISVPDLHTDIGNPLAGLIAAVDWLERQGIRSGQLVSVAVDTPFLPESFTRTMCDALNDSSAAYAVWGDSFYPTNAAWRLEALQNLPKRAIEGHGPKSLKALLAELDGKPVDWTASQPQNSFANLNTLSDLVLLGRRAIHGGS
ncbi:hypothetical protein VW29_13910 [Devosia limi DSM 17137]|uniref:Molybdenum cofactor guanylyltransferase n=1 Tax=Devosia limi DSM 17137 TaxID=1121477 RepID=A0A0F5LN70_9HYPH|nr:molybdenum cofactor guanylyltransferase [Devosia limi]KKB83768.1 hypothetical protein VW29_13910 [Devosia limi DSM 17137]SHE70718.1 molybdopterin-guanine dinucleotide biosynthesis protein A [Devosia limi DSM 17137]